MSAGDLNGDGDLDLVIAFYDPANEILVRLGQPDDSLGPSPTTDYPWFLVVGNFDAGAPPGAVSGKP